MKKYLGVVVLLALAGFSFYEGNIPAVVTWLFAAFMTYMCVVSQVGWERANNSHADTLASLTEATAALKEANDIIKRYQKLLGVD